MIGNSYDLERFEYFPCATIMLRISIVVMSLIPADFDWNKFLIFNRHILGHFNEKTRANAERLYLSTRSKYRLPYRNEDIEILVYSGGKTGTSSLVMSCLRADPSRCAIPVQNEGDLFGVSRIIDIVKSPRNRKLVIISSYREPISRHISAFFQGIRDLVGPNFMALPMHVITNRFIELVRANKWQDYHPFLENDRKNFDNVDIFAKPFNKEEGYQIFETDKVRIIQLRFDKMGNWEPVIRRYAEMPKFRLIPHNLTSTKPEAGLYKRFCAELVLPKDVLDDLFSRSEKHLQYFHTPAEIAGLKQKWYGRCK